MFANLFKKTSTDSVPQQIYGGLMAQARSETFFREFGVPDTVMGRFDMLAMHVYLFARRLRTESGEIYETLNQDVFDLFVADIERALRELGIGDTTVPKRKKKMVRSFYGQIEDFDGLIEADDLAALSKVCKTRYLDGVEGDSKSLAKYMLETEKSLSKQATTKILSGKVDLPQVGV